MRKPKLKETARACGRAFDLAWASSPKMALSQTVLAVLQALLPLGGMLALKQAVDAASGLSVKQSLVSGGGMGGLFHFVTQDPAGRSIVFWFVAGAGIMAVMAFVRALVAWSAEQHAIEVSDHVHGILHEKLTEVDLAFFESTAEQDRLHLVQSQAMTRPVAVLTGLFRFIQGVVGLMGVLVLLAAFEPMLALVLVVAGLPGLLLRMVRSRRMYAWRRELTPLEREAGYFHRLLTTIDSAKELRLQGYGAFCRQRFEAVRRRLREARLAWRRQVLGEELAVQLFALLVAAGILFWLTGQLIGGVITLGSLVMYAQAVQRSQGQVGNLVAALVEIHQSSLFLGAFDELLHETPLITRPSSPRAIPERILSGVAFEEVCFTYPGTERPVLERVSFVLRPGERVALVGVNGSGKSTLVKLLTRLYDPTSGRITVDDIDIREFDPVEWRRRIGVLFQDFGRYQLTAAENIWIGDPQGSPADPRVGDAARRAGLGEVIAGWPHALETPLGRWLHDGVEPSMGQWQRLALARAVVRDADLLVMDEPTSALDPETQRDVFQLLKQASAGRMALLVSHRPELLEIADRILMLHAGRMAEEGAMEALRARHGEFARLFPVAESPQDG